MSRHGQPRRLLLVSFYGDPELSNGPAQFSRSLQQAIEPAGWQLDVWSRALAERSSKGSSEPPPRPTQVPLRNGPRRWFEGWLPDDTVADFTRRELERRRPDAIVLGAWKHLGSVALVAREMGIPVALFLHDYSVLCLRSWLLDANDLACSGPETDEKCIACLAQTLGRKGRAVRAATSLPLVGRSVAKRLGKPSDDRLLLGQAVRQARDHMRSVLDSVDLLIAQTPRTRDLLCENGIDAERIAIVHQCIAPDKALERSPSKARKRPLRFLYLGRWSTSKGADLLVDAFVDADLPEGTELIAAVSNPASVRLPKRGWSEGKRLRICSGFFGSATSQLFAEADVLVVPSRCEDLASRAVLEALEHGLPVIVSSTVGNRYLIEDGVNGLVVESGSREALRNALERAANGADDLDAWQREVRPGPSFESWSTELLAALEGLLPSEFGAPIQESSQVVKDSMAVTDDEANSAAASERAHPNPPAPEANRQPPVVIAVPVYRGGLTSDEELSLRSLEERLGEYERIAVLPESLESPFADWPVERFSDAYFRDVPSYSRLLLTPDFYRRFADYEHLLIFQLDCLVLRNDLDRWCATGYDYLGAPWLKDRHRPELGFSRVGNGGLSLRRIDACLRVLGSRQAPLRGLRTLTDLRTAPTPDFDDLPFSERWTRRLKTLRAAKRGVASYAGSYTVNEDHFWSDRARLFEPDFRIAPIEAALDFSFEVAPSYCFEQNDRRLPFGCHGWWRYDRSFWEPYLPSRT